MTAYKLGSRRKKRPLVGDASNACLRPNSTTAISWTASHTTNCTTYRHVYAPLIRSRHTTLHKYVLID